MWNAQEEDLVSSRDLQRVRRMARRSRTLNSCTSCKTARTKCNDFRPCSRCRRLGLACCDKESDVRMQMPFVALDVYSIQLPLLSILINLISCLPGCVEFGPPLPCLTTLCKQAGTDSDILDATQHTHHIQDPSTASTAQFPMQPSSSAPRSMHQGRHVLAAGHRPEV